jgi:predicted nucleic acid-binding protein
VGVIVDTNILIKYEKGQLDLGRKILGREQEEFFISVITASELLHGVLRANDPSIKSKRHAFVEGILSNFSIFPIDLAIARSHSQLWSLLQAQGKMIGIHDSWIAATCIANGMSLITLNVKEFDKVPGLSIDKW